MINQFFPFRLPLEQGNMADTIKRHNSHQRRFLQFLSLLELLHAVGKPAYRQPSEYIIISCDRQGRAPGFSTEKNRPLAQNGPKCPFQG